MTPSRLNRPDPNARRNAIESLFIWGVLLAVLGLALTAVLCVATPACAGYRNLLLAVAQPPDGYRPGDTITLDLTTQWDGQPLPRRAVWVSVYRPAPAGHVVTTSWLFRTDDAGRRFVPIELLDHDAPGRWFVSAFLLEPLPDGSGDGDSVTFTVGAP